MSYWDASCDFLIKSLEDLNKAKPKRSSKTQSTPVDSPQTKLSEFEKQTQKFKPADAKKVHIGVEDRARLKAAKAGTTFTPKQGGSAGRTFTVVPSKSKGTPPTKKERIELGPQPRSSPNYRLQPAGEKAREQRKSPIMDMVMEGRDDSEKESVWPQGFKSADTWNKKVKKDWDEEKSSILDHLWGGSKQTRKPPAQFGAYADFKEKAKEYLGNKADKYYSGIRSGSGGEGKFGELTAKQKAMMAIIKRMPKHQQDRIRDHHIKLMTGQKLSPAGIRTRVAAQVGAFQNPEELNKYGWAYFNPDVARIIAVNSFNESARRASSAIKNIGSAVGEILFQKNSSKKPRRLKAYKTKKEWGPSGTDFGDDDWKR